MPQIKYYTDANVPYSIVKQLRIRDVNLTRCEDVDLKYVDDETHLNYAVEHGLTIVTYDNDFTRLDTLWRQEQRNHFGIIYILPSKQGIIGYVVEELFFIHEAILADAATLEADIYNQVRYIS